MTDPISNLYHSDESPEQHAERLLAEGEAKQEVENDDRAGMPKKRIASGIALSIRQPWAHLIIYARKDVENRDWPTAYRGRVLIHAGKTMTRGDYDAAVIFCSGLPDGGMPNDFRFPTFEELKSKCGGIVGVMNITDCVTKSNSPWFCGRYGFVIDAAGELDFQPCKGALGFFHVKP